jgi:hypothetical protein
VISNSLPDVSVNNYGDDNVWSADTADALAAFVDFMSDYFTLDLGERNTFLGFMRQPDGRLRLPTSSYVLKTCLHERAPLSIFRKKPYLGWAERRKNFLKYGVEDELLTLFAFEDTVLEKIGMPWPIIEALAIKEKADMDMESVPFPVLLGKEYLLTHEQRLKFGSHIGFTPDETAPHCATLAAGGLLDGAF